MATSLKNLNIYSGLENIDFSKVKVGIAISEYNEDITGSLYKAAVETLTNEGVKEENIITKYVPGAYELTLGAQHMAMDNSIDAVICIGCVIQGETKHFDFICSAIAHGITDVSLKYNKPVAFGVLTPNDQQQALDRAGGKHGNKGVEAAVAVLKMLSF
ncbi:6,7-dimethyl-8-ribityllumazine synthase [Flammeovirgaceae bacterium SG7u.111]|nr:6,7-dimethyl-8-ribityllumazine synthase [Flammeovirgaceae bacterium SG7u.132]WPO34266.1 6,7-dimethyl-8-ribityllumazine synthase [Flammeovirgaceae bacterium SG7u.111]